MAIPPQVSSAIRPLARLTRAVGPTGIGVLLSVAAHAAFLILGPKTNLSFAALSEAAQQADAEETIVPLVQLSPAEQNRLPDFAQPDRQSSDLTGLGSLALPSGLPFVPNPTEQKRRTAAAPFPSATLPQTTQRRPVVGNNPSSTRSFTRQPSISLPISPTPPAGFVPSSPDPATAPIPDLSEDGENSGAVEPGSSQSGSADDLQLPAQRGLTLAEALARTQEAGANQPETATDDQAEPEYTAAATPGAATADPAQGDPSQLRDDFTYDNTNVSEEAAAANTEDWLVAIYEGKGNIAADTAELTIDSQFKVCKDISPSYGLVGVLVNPDGTQTNATVLKSTGYEVLNRQALEAVENTDFGQPEALTQYQVKIDVIYMPEGCVDSLPEGAAE